ncbi:anthranilate synthase component I [Algisphaera agarilytica]|uniref:Anthranilate synthase component 1 n=1 Tax=Algisphaera agarilytica TaxID=1385975 RepID=A0A7X0LLT3_9BACT|nr:anthranilate synthase component I [Algisphaera agarilytica]MBB6430951.1 anthranilate synthase component 1 [Algisphaera agarilytica]
MSDPATQPHPSLPDPQRFAQRFAAAQSAPAESHPIIPVFRRLLNDSLTPVLAYRRLVRPDDRMAPSYLFESVVGGDRVGRFSFLGSRPAAEVVARGHEVVYTNHAAPDESRTFTSDDPLMEMQKLTANYALDEESYALLPTNLPGAGGWVGVAGYDTVRYLEGESLPNPAADDRQLPDLHMQLYLDTVVFDHVQKTLLLITFAQVKEHGTAEDAYAAAQSRLDDLASRLLESDVADGISLPPGHVSLDTPPPTLPDSNMGQGGYQKAVEACKEFIQAGDAFQIVPSQRFEVQTQADPFDIYRSLRVVNPSPYMFYLQIDGGILVGSSPEILVNVTDRIATSRPLAGTRHRGATPAEDARLEAELLADPKDRSEHIMLVDLHRNDIGRIAEPGTVELPELLVVEKYSHVMHISSAVQGRVRDGLTAWDALRVSLPVGTVSGAPKVRAMQIIDDLEPTRRGPYGGAVGHADFAGNMDMCIALRTMVILPSRGLEVGGLGVGKDAGEGDPSPQAPKSPGAQWTVHIQAGAGIVADSDPDAEHQETVNKAAALAKAVEVAEHLFT